MEYIALAVLVYALIVHPVIYALIDGLKYAWKWLTADRGPGPTGWGRDEWGT